MGAEQWSQVFSFFTVVFIVNSYFVRKSRFLLLQSLAMLFLSISYCLDGLYFPMIGLSVGIARALIYYAYEKKNKLAPLVWPYIFSGVSIAAHLIVNVGILHTQSVGDIFYLLGLIGYAFIFRIRDVQLLRYTVTIPTALSLLYTVVADTTIFAVLTYAFELCANIIAILKYHVLKKEEVEYEKN